MKMRVSVNAALLLKELRQLAVPYTIIIGIGEDHGIWIIPIAVDMPDIATIFRFKISATAYGI